MICLLMACSALYALATGRLPAALPNAVLTYSSLVGMLGGLVGFLYGLGVAATDQPQHTAGDTARDDPGDE